MRGRGLEAQSHRVPLHRPPFESLFERRGFFRIHGLQGKPSESGAGSPVDRIPLHRPLFESLVERRGFFRMCFRKRKAHVGRGLGGQSHGSPVVECRTNRTSINQVSFDAFS